MLALKENVVVRCYMIWTTCRPSKNVSLFSLIWMGKGFKDIPCTSLPKEKNA